MKSYVLHSIRLAILPLVAVVSSTAWAGDTGAAHDHVPAPAAADWTTAEAALIEAVEAYHEALTDGDLAAMDAHVVASDQFTMFEGRHSNLGWTDYRDNHLAPELGDLGKVRFRLSFYRVRIDGSLGYASFAFEVLPKEGPEMDFGTGFATAVLDRTDDGWKVRHLHTS